MERAVVLLVLVVVVVLLRRRHTRTALTEIRQQLLLFLLLSVWQPCSPGTAEHSEEPPLSRQKRLLWITNDGRLALPPGTSLVISPSLTMPFVRYPPEGFLSNMSISLPFTIDFDKLGLTDNQNPYGVLPPLLARSMGRMSGQLLAEYVGHFLASRRRTGRAATPPPPPPPHANFHGGERALLYAVVEDFLTNFGMDGRACLLRAICEVHGHSLRRFGLLGEILKLFFTASKSPFAEVLDEYVQAEKAGTVDGDCWPYYKDCPKSLFLTPKNKYTNEVDDSEHEELTEQIVPREVSENVQHVTLNRETKFM